MGKKKLLEEILLEHDMLKRKRFETFLWMGDQHVPYQDVKTNKMVLKFCKDLKPDTIILGGDVMDFYSVSSYDKDPSRANKLQKEIDKGIKYLEKVRSASSNSKIMYLEGNHENRLERYLKRHPELWDIKALKIPSLLELTELDIKYKQHYLHKNFLFKHGDYCNKYSSNKELEVEGINGMSGHSHRNQMFSKNTRAGYLAWYTVGHLSDEKMADYIKGIPNWQQGIAVIHFKKNSKRYHVTQLPIVKNKLVYEGEEYK